MARTRSTSTSTSTSLAAPEGANEDPLAQAGERAGESIGELAERATDLGYTRADTGRRHVAEGLTSLAGTIRRASSELETQQPAVANVTQTAADQTERIARYLQETDARQMVGNVEDLARRQPLLFLGGAFVLGLAASRLLKAATGGTDTGAAATGNGRIQPAYRTGSGSSYDRGVGADYRATGPGATELSGTGTREGV